MTKKRKHTGWIFLPLIRIAAVVVCGLFWLAIPVVADEVEVDLKDGWTFSKGEEYAGAIGALEPGTEPGTMVISYDFSGGGQYVAAWVDLERPEELSGIAVTASGSGGNLGVALLDSSGQTLIYRLGLVDGGTKTYELPLGKPSESYGGADDKTIHYPVKTMRLIVEKNSAVPEGEIIISGIDLRTEPVSQ